MVIKIDNTPGKNGDSSVEVEYSDSETPIITTRKQGQRPHSIAGHPTTPGDKDELWWDEDFEDIPLTSTEPDSADAYIEEILSDTHEDEFHDSQEHGEFIEDGQFEDIDGYHGHPKVPEHVSQGDTDEWEDCETEEFWGSQASTDSAGLGSKGTKSPANHSLSPEDALRLNVKNLNPDAPEFTPTSPLSPLSPEMMKTPEGHVKVANWAEEMKTPSSGEKNISFKSASPASNEDSPKGTKESLTSLPRRIENDFESPKKDDNQSQGKKADETENEDNKKTEKEVTDTFNSQNEKTVDDSSEKESTKTDQNESENSSPNGEKVVSSSGETTEEKSSSGGTTADKVKEVGEETKQQMAKSELDSDSKDGSSKVEEKEVAQVSTENVESNKEGPDGDSKVPDEGKC